MPTIKCSECGKEIYIDPLVTPYRGEVKCERCGTHLFVDVNMREGSTVTRMYPTLDDLKGIWHKLIPLEQSRLTEASRCSGVGACTACESMCFDALCSILRRIYGGRRELGHYVGKMEQDPDLRELAGAILYFKNIRNKVDHPNGISTPLEADSTF